MDIEKISNVTNLFLKCASRVTNLDRTHVAGAVSAVGDYMQNNGMSKLQELVNSKIYPQNTAFLISSEYYIKAAKGTRGWDTSGSYIVFSDSSILNDPKWKNYFIPIVNEANNNLKISLKDALDRLGDLNGVQIAERMPWNVDGSSRINFGVDME